MLDIYKYAYLTDDQLFRLCEQYTRKFGHVIAVKGLMELRRDLQKALAKYAKDKPNIDDVQRNIVHISEMIIRYCRKWYVQWARKEALKEKPDLLHRPQKLEGKISNAWELYVRAHSY